MNQRQFDSWHAACALHDGIEVGEEIQIFTNDQWIPATVVGRSLKGWPIIDRADFFQENQGNRIVSALINPELYRKFVKVEEDEL